MLVLKLLVLLLVVNISVSKSLVCGFNKKCVKSYRCPTADISQAIEECGYKKGVKYVCCPIVGLESYEKCEKYSRKTQQYRLETDLGTLQLPSYAFLAALGYGEEQNIKWKCTGSLISSKFVLTSAHCLNQPDFGRVKFVRMGTENFSLSFDHSFHSQDLTIKYAIHHPDFNETSRLHDIALLRLNRKVHFSDYVKPACLELNSKSKVLRENLVSVGWGFENNDSLKLFKYDHNIIDEQECVHNFKQLDKEIDVKSQFCLKNNMTIGDICQRYTGEPVIGYNVKYNMPSIIGIGSFGSDCNKSPGVYTEVSKYIDWIESVVWE